MSQLTREPRKRGCRTYMGARWSMRNSKHTACYRDFLPLTLKEKSCVWQGWGLSVHSHNTLKDESQENQKEKSGPVRPDTNRGDSISATLLCVFTRISIGRIEKVRAKTSHVASLMLFAVSPYSSHLERERSLSSEWAGQVSSFPNRTERSQDTPARRALGRAIIHTILPKTVLVHTCFPAQLLASLFILKMSQFACAI